MTKLKFICVDCRGEFESAPYPANTHPDDPEPRCFECIDRMLDEIEAEPLDELEISRIMRKVRHLIQDETSL